MTASISASTAPTFFDLHTATKCESLLHVRKRFPLAGQLSGPCFLPHFPQFSCVAFVAPPLPVPPLPLPLPTWAERAAEEWSYALSALTEWLLWSLSCAFTSSWWRAVSTAAWRVSLSLTGVSVKLQNPKVQAQDDLSRLLSHCQNCSLQLNHTGNEGIVQLTHPVLEIWRRIFPSHG